MERRRRTKEPRWVKCSICLFMFMSATIVTILCLYYLHTDPSQNKNSTTPHFQPKESPTGTGKYQNNPNYTFESQPEKGFKGKNEPGNDISFRPKSKNVVSRRRRSLIETHDPDENKWIQLARYTANKTGVNTPCWVCSFRPHHAQDNPTTVPIPLSQTDIICMLTEKQLGLYYEICGDRDSKSVYSMRDDDNNVVTLVDCEKGKQALQLPQCNGYDEWSHSELWPAPWFSENTNQTNALGLHFYRNDPHDSPELCFQIPCNKGDFDYGESKCKTLINLGPGGKCSPSSLCQNEKDGTYLSYSKLWINVTHFLLSSNLEGSKIPAVTPLLIEVPTKGGFPAPKGHVWLCGERAHLYLGKNWCGTCTLAKLSPSSIVLSDELMQEAIQNHGHHNVHKHSVSKRELKVGQAFVPFSDNGGRKPRYGDGQGILFTLLPWVGISSLTKRINEIWWTLEDMTDVLDDITAQLQNNIELKAVATMAMQNRLALDAIYAESNGMCTALGIDHCCTHVPDSSSNWTLIRDKVRKLKDFLTSQEDQAPPWTWMQWLDSGSWIHIIQKVALFIGIILLLCLIVFGCIFPLLSKMISRAIAQMTGGIFVQDIFQGENLVLREILEGEN